MNAPEKIDSIDINALAKECLEEAKNDITQGLAILMARGEGDEMVYRGIMRPLYRTACYELLSRQVRGARAKLWAPPTRLVKAATDRAISSSAQLLLNFPLPGGKPLSLAVKADVERAAKFYYQQSSDMTCKSRWLERIGKSMTGTKMVKDVFTEEKLRELQEECR